MRIASLDDKYSLDVDFVLVTPDRAQRWLDTQPKQRAIRADRVDDLKRDVRDGAWEPANGQTIVFDEHGLLMDGQHRLSAIAGAHVAVWCLVVRGASRETMPTIDVGIVRSQADLLHMEGEANSVALSGVVTWLWRFERGSASIKSNRRPTRSEAIVVLKNHPGIQDSVAAARRVQRIGKGVSYLATLHYVLGQIDAERRDAFFDALASGERMVKGDPVLALRDWLITSPALARGQRPRTWVLMAVTIKAWNAFLAGKQMKIIRVTEDEVFPAIAGLVATTQRAVAAK